jgi:hypothetical protein
MTYVLVSLSMHHALTNGLSVRQAQALHQSSHADITSLPAALPGCPALLLPLLPSCTAHPCTLHGVATWFDVLFDGTTSQRWLSTAPGLPSTHWFQLRCVLQQPLVVLTPNSRLTGCLRLVAHERQSYDIHLELEAPPVGPGMPAQKVRVLQDCAPEGDYAVNTHRLVPLAAA